MQTRLDDVALVLLLHCAEYRLRTLQPRRGEFCLGNCLGELSVAKRSAFIVSICRHADGQQTPANTSTTGARAAGNATGTSMPPSQLTICANTVAPPDHQGDQRRPTVPMPVSGQVFIAAPR